MSQRLRCALHCGWCTTVVTSILTRAVAAGMPLVSLARGEAESFQVVMTSAHALRNLSWSVALGGGGAHGNVAAESFLVGYAHSVKLPPWLSLTKVWVAMGRRVIGRDAAYTSTFVFVIQNR